MSDRDKPKQPESDNSNTFTRRRFLQGTIAAATGVLALPEAGQATAMQTSGVSQSSSAFQGKRPNFLILMCDEMRFPPIYESQEIKKFRQQYLQTQNFLRQNGADFQRHYA